MSRGGPAGFWEVMNDQPTTGSMLQVLNEELDNGRVIYRSHAADRSQLRQPQPQQLLLEVRRVRHAQAARPGRNGHGAREEGVRVRLPRFALLLPAPVPKAGQSRDAVARRPLRGEARAGTRAATARSRSVGTRVVAVEAPGAVHHAVSLHGAVARAGMVVGRSLPGGGRRRLSTSSSRSTTTRNVMGRLASAGSRVTACSSRR